MTTSSIQERGILDKDNNQDQRVRRLVEREAIPFGLQGALGESFLGPYGVFLGAPKPLVALLSTVPLLFGALVQPLALTLMDRFHHRSKLLFLLTLLQGTSWLPIIWAGYLGYSGETSGIILLVAISVYFIFGMMAGPIWNSLIGDIIAPTDRIAVLSKRSLYVGVCMLSGFFVIGSLLRIAKQHDFVLLGFSITFGLAGISRIVSSLLLKKHPNPPSKAPREDAFTFIQFLNRSYESNFLKFVLFVAVTNLSINISAPFATVYFLRDLSLSYTDYCLATATTFIFQLLVMRKWGRILEEVGSRRVMMVSTIGFAITPFLWLFSAKLWWLCLISGLRGSLSAGFQLSVTSFLFDAVTPSKRARCAAYQAIINNFAVVLGALCGGWIVAVVPRVDGLGSSSLNTDSNILLLFLLSGIFNVVTLAFLTSFKEVREVKPKTASSILFELALK